MALQGRLRVPGDKSISHRALMLGAIASGETRIQGLLLGEDPRSTARCFQAMGVQISDLAADWVTVRGVAWANLAGAGRYPQCRQLRHHPAADAGVIGLPSAALLRGHTGDDSLRSRPMGRVIKPLSQMGATIWGRQGQSLAPLAVQGQRLRPQHYTSPVASAQVKSCILLAGLMVDGQTSVSEPSLSRDHSERMLRAFGAELTLEPDRHTVTVYGPAQLTGQTVIVPGDISSAAFWLVAAAITPGSELIIENVGVNPTRTGILEALQAMQADITLENQRLVTGEPVADLRVRHSQLQAAHFSGALIPRLIDEIPILAVAALFAKGTTVIRDASELRVKECDRITVMANQLNRLGAQVTEHADGLDILGGATLHGSDVDSHTDHRVGMSLTIAALRAQGVTQVQRAEGGGGLLSRLHSHPGPPLWPNPSFSPMLIPDEGAATPVAGERLGSIMGTMGTPKMMSTAVT
ncbi:3-phosphoshikimate 1-carboxyvinyltransferase [Halomicronema hongdechloris C2206]|uniref:3-phosphoshikimate 1-carboxyvinyltransferase n=1 Tax=Halomicronema hongdechloris C2206 TaxID=1641165 RepID=A0A1Z3HV18_9CYAN|nr:3-phosphoshikimate 1-carboxyvinyltransferase [Halomicronema hongdechloris]ASC73977.1 3-phosphoshikimate 1-carboxyvinyltransferase [Halomicronema hongdechloris C2206]